MVKYEPHGNRHPQAKGAPGTGVPTSPIPGPPADLGNVKTFTGQHSSGKGAGGSQGHKGTSS